MSYIFVHKMSKVANETTSLEERTTKGRHLIVKVIGIKVPNRITGK